MLTGLILAAAVAVLAALLAVTRRRAMHALLYLVASLLATAVMMLLLGAPFAAALEVIVYAGAIVILMVFVVMLVEGGAASDSGDVAWRAPRMWAGPTALVLVLAAELLTLTVGGALGGQAAAVAPREVGSALFGTYVVAVELAAFLLLAGLVGAFHVGRRPEGRP